MRKRVMTGARLPKALAAGILEDGGRVLFLLRKDPATGAERLELPCILVLSGRSPLAEISAEFRRQTGIDAQVHEIILEGRFNAGSRKRRSFVPALAFKVTARERFARPSPEFSGFKWLRLDEAVRQRLSRSTEWLRNAKAAGSDEHQGRHEA